MTPHPRTPELLDWMTTRGDAMLSLLEEMARIESPSLIASAQDPMFRLIGEELESLGYRVRRLSGRETGGQLLAAPVGRKRGRAIQLLVGHVDTVWPIGTLAEMPVAREEGRLRGPGVFDMKGGLVQMLFALRGLEALALEPEVTPVVFLNSDEEIGSLESGHRVRALSRVAARAFVLEPGLHPEGRLKTSRRGGGTFQLRVRGRSAHTGLAAGEGASAIHELAHLVQTLYRLSEPERGIHVNVGEIRGGTRPNVVAADASIVIDVRVETLADGREVEERIHALASAARTIPGTSVEIVGSVDRPPMEPTPRNRRLWHDALEVADALGLEIEEGMSGGASDGNTTSLFTATLDGLGAVGDGAHALHEYIEVDRMPERAALLGGLLLLGSPETPQRG